MDSQALVNLIKAQRSSWVDLEPGKRLRVSRPTEFEIQRDLLKTAADGTPQLKVQFADVVSYATDWEGFTEAGLVGSAGASSPVPFTREVWEAVAADRAEWVGKIAKKIIDLIVAHQSAKGEAEKN